MGIKSVIKLTLNTLQITTNTSLSTPPHLAFALRIKLWIKIDIQTHTFGILGKTDSARALVVINLFPSIGSSPN